MSETGKLDNFYNIFIGLVDLICLMPKLCAFNLAEKTSVEN